jgi:antibiotic biosynthesis monooxygenase (ABM) superfamily enzyme
MAKTQWTVAQVARITKRSDTVIAKLAKEGKLKASWGHSPSGRKAWLVEHAGTRQELVEKVHGLVPKGGYRKNVAPKKSKSAKTPLALQQVLQFMELSDNSRQMLLLIGQKATEETLELLVGLV